jgi:quinohemoprotein ethanol dehydrogenase
VLKAFDPLKGESVWEVPQPHHWNGGILATRGGLVFQGNSEGNINAYDSDTGELLWSFAAFTAFLAPPVSYEIDGRQYIAILAGTGGGGLFDGESESMASVEYGNEGKLLVFALDGSAELAAPRLRSREIPDREMVEISAQDLKRGEHLYFETCAMCHGAEAKSTGVISDLRMMSSETLAQFREIVLGGLRADKGMAGFADVLDPQDAEKIKAYIIHRAREDRAEIETIQVGEVEEG